MKIMFVCTGNICRSPMAEMMLRHMTKGVEVISAGTMAYKGNMISGYSRAVLENHLINVNESFESSPIAEKQIASSDIVLTMTQEQKRYILRFYPEYAGKVWVLTEYVNPAELVDIDDPYGFPYEVYEEVYEQIKMQLKKIIKKLGL